jgi:hypothetical protein
MVAAPANDAPANDAPTASSGSNTSSGNCGSEISDAACRSAARNASVIGDR